MFRPLTLALSVVLFAACSEEGSSSTPEPPTIAFDLAAHFDAEGAFFDFPYPSDLRLTPEGTPDVAAFPYPDVNLFTALRKGAQDRRGFPVVSVGYFRLTEEPAPRDPGVVVEGGAKAPLVLLDVDPASPERGTAVPVVAETLAPDQYAPAYTLAVAARPGVLLAPGRKYAYFVTRGVGLANGGELSPAPAFADVASGHGDPRLVDLYRPFWETLDQLGVARTDVAAATVFTTGDVIADSVALEDRILAQSSPQLTDLTLEPDPDDKLPNLCHLRARIVQPQFQKGTPPYDTDGLFVLDEGGTPIVQREETVPVSITLPRTPMPPGGYPLVLYAHGSGGVSRSFVDDEKPVANPNTPAVVLAEQGFAVAGSAMPLSPERLPGAGDFVYINPDNLVAIRDTFRQGVIESRRLLSAVLALRIPPGLVAGCSEEKGEIHFAADVHAQGQSMGGLYTNLIAASDPRIKVVVGTGAGGYWLYTLLETHFVENIGGLFAVVLRTSSHLTVNHPAMHIAETALEAGDSMIAANRISRRPLPGHPARSIYEPVGKDDSFFTTTIYDAMALAYGNPRAGDEVWPSMHEAQKLVGLDAVAPYPVRANVVSENGMRYTGAVVQYASDGTFDSHQIYTHLSSVMHQYACFHASFEKTKTAVVSPPDPRGTPCAE